MTKTEKTIIFELYLCASETSGINRDNKEYLLALEREEILWTLIERLSLDGEYNRWYEKCGYKKWHKKGVKHETFKRTTTANGHNL